MTLKLLLEFAVVIAAILMGSRYGGVGLGLWGGAGVLVLSYAFGLPPTAPPIDVMLIILAVIMATSVMEAAGGIDWLVRVAEGLIRRNPKQITIVAPVVSWLFTLGAGLLLVAAVVVLVMIRIGPTAAAEDDEEAVRPVHLG
jgi:anaerobic C4-dicarboxylate transporter